MRHLMSLFLLLSLSSFAEDALEVYKRELQLSDKAFLGFESSKGKDFYYNKNKLPNGEVMSCTSCHTENPKAEGLTKQNKVILPMAKIANPDRYTDMKKVEKWFKRNCDDVYKRPCTTLEKGNFIQYMYSIK